MNMKLLEINERNILISTDVFHKRNIELLFGENLDSLTNDVVHYVDAYIEPSYIGQLRKMIEQKVRDDDLIKFLTKNDIVKFLTFGKPELTQRLLINILIEEDKNILLEQFITLNSSKKLTSHSKFISHMLSSFCNICSEQDYSMFMSFLNKKPTYFDLNNSSVTLSNEYDANEMKEMIAKYHETKNILNDIQGLLISKSYQQNEIYFIQSDIFMCTLIANAQRFEKSKEKLTQLLEFIKNSKLEDPLKISYFLKETEEYDLLLSPQSYKQRFIKNFIINLLIEINNLNDEINIENIWQIAKNEI